MKNLTAKAKTLDRTTSFTSVQIAAAILELARAGFHPKNIEIAIDALPELAKCIEDEEGGEDDE